MVIGLGIGDNYIDNTPTAYTENFSASLDGSSGCIITCANSEGVKIVAGEPGTFDTPFKPTSAISVSCWVKPNAWDMTIGNAIHAFVSNDRTGGFELGLVNTGGNNTTLRFQIGVTDDGSGAADPRGNISATVNEATVEALSGWKHIVGTYDGTTAKIYVNADNSTGVTNATSASSTTINYTTNSNVSGHKDTQVNPIAIGGNTHHERNFHGLIDNVAIFNRALDATNVTAIYNSGNPFDLRSDSGSYNHSANLIGFWTFEENQGDTSEDLAGNAGVATLKGGATFSTDVV